MKKKKIKKMIKELTDKFEKELDVEVDLLNEKIRCTKETVSHIDERTMALDTVKVQRTLDMMKEQLQKAKELDDKIKILMDRTSTNYNACSDTGITFENAYNIIKYMADRGAKQEELNNLKDYFNRYIFRSKLFKIYKTYQETEEKNDG